MRYDLTGQRFGRLTVISQDQARPKRHDIYWVCRCDCGNTKSVTTGHLTAGTVKSCGCIKREQAVERFRKAAKDNITHGKANTCLYSVWHCMKQRCENKNNPGYRWYGKKGIRVCDEWKEFAGFAKWAYANGYEDRKGVERRDRLSIDRIDSNKDYCPENCRWITVHENTIRATRARWDAAKHSNGSSGTKNTVSVDQF